MSKVLFPLGQCGITPGAQSMLESMNIDPATLLWRHQSGEWQDMSTDDQIRNSESVIEGTRVFSAYKLTDDVRVWVITEADRSSTTILLPSEY